MPKQKLRIKISHSNCAFNLNQMLHCNWNYIFEIIWPLLLNGFLFVISPEHQCYRIVPWFSLCWSLEIKGELFVMRTENRFQASALYLKVHVSIHGTFFLSACCLRFHLWTSIRLVICARNLEDLIIYISVHVKPDQIHGCLESEIDRNRNLNWKPVLDRTRWKFLLSVFLYCVALRLPPKFCNFGKVPMSFTT